MVRVIFVGHDGAARTVDGAAGLSLMEVAKAHDVPGIEAVCGGNAYCGTCRVGVAAEWLARLAPAADFELELLAAVGTLGDGGDGAATRLSCQIVLDDGLAGLVVRTPAQQC